MGKKSVLTDFSLISVLVTWVLTIISGDFGLWRAEDGGRAFPAPRAPSGASSPPLLLAMLSRPPAGTSQQVSGLSADSGSSIFSPRFFLETWKPLG